MIDRYRIDRACQTIYEYNNDDYCYYFLTNFANIGAEVKNQDETIIKKIEIWKDIQQG